MVVLSMLVKKHTVLEIERITKVKQAKILDLNQWFNKGKAFKNKQVLSMAFDKMRTKDWALVYGLHYNLFKS